MISAGYREIGEKSICQIQKHLRKFADFIRRSGLAKSGSVDVIAHAKVPLVKFVDRVTSIRIDMSFENDSGPKGVQIYQTWRRSFPAMPILVAIIKQFLMMRGYNEVQHGGIGGFTVTCLVTSLLQNLPRVQAGELIPEENLGEMLLEFLDFYGNRFDVSRTGILMEPPGYFDKVSVLLVATTGSLIAVAFSILSIENAPRILLINKAWPTDSLSWIQMIGIVISRVVRGTF